MKSIEDAPVEELKHTSIHERRYNNVYILLNCVTEYNSLVYFVFLWYPSHPILFAGHDDHSHVTDEDMKAEGSC